MDTAIVVFTRDLRLHDNPALHQACARARQVVPLFVADPAIVAPPNRARFLAESLTDLRQALRERGGDLVVRNGDPAAEVIRLATDVQANAVYLADDVSHYATARRHKLERECARHRLDLTLTPGLTVVPPAELRPAGGGHYRVFTPYWRAWRAAAWRRPCPVPRAIRMPPVLRKPGPGTGRIPAAGGGASPAWPRAARRPAASGSSAGARASWPATTRTTTTCPAMRPPGSAPTCGSAACRRSRWRSARWTARPEMSPARSSAGSSPGVTSSTR